MPTATLEKMFIPLTIASAPEKSRPILEGIQKNYGFIPNLMATFAHNPAVLEGYLAMDAAFGNGSFTPAEQQVILLTASVQNECSYCAAAHSTIAKGFLKVPGEIISSIRKSVAVPDKKLDALVNLTREIVRERGSVKPATVSAFLNAGYRKEQVMEILLGVALKTVSNYLDRISPAELDPAFQPESTAR